MSIIISSFPRSAANDFDLASIGAIIETGFTYKPYVETNKWSGFGRSSFVVTGQGFGQGEITLPVTYHAEVAVPGLETPVSAFHAVQQRAQILEALMLGEFTFDPGDGYQYICALSDISDIEWLGNSGAKKTYKLIAVKSGALVHDAFEEEYLIHKTVKSTVPRTDAIIAITSGVAEAYSIIVDINDGTKDHLQFGWGGESSDSAPILIDGINKRITVNGQNNISEWTWSDFPYFVPGDNTIKVGINGVVPTASGYIEYYPIYI